MTASCPLFFVLFSTLLIACQHPARARQSSPNESPRKLELAMATAVEEEPSDPTKREIPLPCASDGWNASLVIDNGETGIWTVESCDVFPQYAAPEIVGLDDKGTCHVLVSYSGKWTPLSRVHDGKWVGGLEHGDIDPRVPGVELYAGGMLGNLYQLVPYPHGALDSRLIAYFPGKELHTIVSGDLDPRVEGKELLVFTRPGGLYRVSPTGEHGTFESTLLEDLPGRVRDAVVLPAREGHPREIATVSRAGWLKILSITEQGPRWDTIHQEAMGKGRLAMRGGKNGEPLVLFAGMDDGRVLRHERGEGENWSTETIYAGPQGVRGIAAGRFDQDPGVETVAVFGYSGKVQLLKRSSDGWKVETIFIDRDRGHSLAVAEVDGRNGTREIIGSGYGARIFLLSRPPGYGLTGVAIDPDGDRQSWLGQEQ
jgi:hypothetical protein